jgi:hypothetical protein
MMAKYPRHLPIFGTVFIIENTFNLKTFCMLEVKLMLCVLMQERLAICLMVSRCLVRTMRACRTQPRRATNGACARQPGRTSHYTKPQTQNCLEPTFFPGPKSGTFGGFVHNKQTFTHPNIIYAGI